MASKISNKRNKHLGRLVKIKLAQKLLVSSS